MASVPLFGGFRGGRKRADGLPAGSPEAKEADRAADAKRKRDARAELRRLAPAPALPSSLAPAPDSGAPPGVALPGQVASQGLAPPVLWQAEMIAEFSDELVTTIEASRVRKFGELAREGKLPEPVIDKIQKDSKFPAGAKSTIQKAAPRVACKWLNKFGVSAEYSDELILVTAVGSIVMQGRKLETMLIELIEQRRKQINANNSPMAAAPGRAGGPGPGP